MDARLSGLARRFLEVLPQVGERSRARSVFRFALIVPRDDQGAVAGRLLVNLKADVGPLDPVQMSAGFLFRLPGIGLFVPDPTSDDVLAATEADC